jgi:hypothetical protein
MHSTGADELSNRLETQSQPQGFPTLKSGIDCDGFAQRPGQPYGKSLPALREEPNRGAPFQLCYSITVILADKRSGYSTPMHSLRLAKKLLTIGPGKP